MKLPKKLSLFFMAMFFIFCICFSQNQHNCEDAYIAFVKSDFDTAIQIGQLTESSDFLCEITMAFSFLERGELNKNKSDIKLADKLLKQVREKIDLKKIDLVIKFSRLLDKRSTIKNCEKLGKDAFEKVSTPEDIRFMIKFLKPKYNQAIYLPALNALKRYLKLNREYVYKKGGTIPSNNRDIFDNQELIEALVTLGHHSKKAWDCLELIEEPSLKFLKKVNEKWAKKLESSILKIIEKRKKKYPDSTWYSAYPQES